MNKVERHMAICKDLNGVYERKNHDYGDSFHDTFVEEGMAMARIRLSDKLGRFKKLSKAGSEQKVNDESIRDTLLDLANYAIMTVMEMDILAEEDEKTRLKGTLNELRSKDSLLNKTFQIANSDHICPVCGNKLTYQPEIDKYICGQCGVMYAISALNGAPDIGEDPCKKCTYPAKATCCGCSDRYAWEERRRKTGDANASEDEQADGR